MPGRPKHSAEERAPADVVVILLELRTAGPAREAYERDEPETRAPLPAGVEGFRAGGRRLR